MSKTNKIVLVIMIFLGLGIFAYSLRNERLDVLLSEMTSLNLWWLFVALLFMFLSLVCEALVVKTLLKDKYPKLPAWDVIRVPLIEQLFNGITPFASGGQPAQLFALVQSNVEAGKATSALLMKFVVYQAMIVVNFIFCLLFGFHYISNKLHVMTLLVIFGFITHFVVILGLLLVMYLNNFARLLVNICLKPFKLVKKGKFYMKWHVILNDKIDSFYLESKRLRQDKILLCKISLITSVQLMFYYTIPYFILLSLHVSHVNLVHVTVLHVLIVMVISLFPIPGGAGGAEYSFSLVFATFVTENSKLVLAMILWRLVTYYFGMLSGIVGLAIPPKVLRKNADNQ